MSALVSVQAAAFRFCRYATAGLVWWAYFARRIEPLLVAVAFWFLSLVLGVHRSPLVLLWSLTLGRWPALGAARRALDPTVLRIAHGLATAVGLTVLGIWIRWPVLGPAALLLFAIAKTLSAAGLCPAERLARCLGGSGCCALTGRRGDA